MSEAKQRIFVAATPGYSALLITPTDTAAEGYEVLRTPVLAWELKPSDSENPNSDFYAIPVTSDRVGAFIPNVAVLAPDGRVRGPEFEIHENEEAWLARYTTRDLMKEIDIMAREDANK